MAYSTANPPQIVSQTIGGTHRSFLYKSTDPVTDVRVSGYFTDGWKLGMRAGDHVLVIDTDASPIASSLCTVVQATASVVDISDGTAITATDTD